jgi:hypothetical protein
MKKRAFSIILALVLVCGLLPVTARAAEYKDVEGTWAEDAILRFTQYGIVEGSNGLFSPDSNLTRGQMAVIIAKLLNLPEAESAGFNDVDPDKYYADAINRCYAAGIMLGSNGNAMPDDSISRQDTMVLLARALGIEPSETADEDLKDYSDASSVSSYAKGYVAAMTEAGIVNGVGGGKVGASTEVDRASTMTILDRAIEEIVSKSGSTVEAKGTGIVLVTADDVTVTGTVKDVVVAQGTGTGSVTVKDATVTGTVTVQSDAKVEVTGNTTVNTVTVAENAKANVTVADTVKTESVKVKGAESNVQVSGTVTDVTVANTATNATVTVVNTTVTGDITVKANATVNVTGNTEVKNVTVDETAAKASVNVDTGVKAEKVEVKAAESNVQVSGTVTDVTVASTATNATVTLNNATAGSVNVQTNATVAVTGSTKVENVTVDETAAKAAVTVEKDATVNTVEVKAEDTKVDVSGKVDTVTVSDGADNVTVNTTETATISNVNVDANNTNVSGSGNVSNVTVTTDKSETVKVDTTGTTTTVTDTPAATTPTTPSNPSTSTTVPTNISNIIRDGVNTLNGITAFNSSLATLSYNGTRTVTVTVNDGTATVGQVSDAIANTLVSLMNTDSAVISQVGAAGQTLTLNGSIQKSDLIPFVKNIFASNNVGPSTTIGTLRGTSYSVSLTDVNNQSATITVRFVSAN